MDESITTRKLTGCCDRSPLVQVSLLSGWLNKNNGRDYVIVGPHNSWTGPSQPVSLKIDEFGKTRTVAKERNDYISRGWKLRDGSWEGTVILADGEEVPVTVEVETVC